MYQKLHEFCLIVTKRIGQFKYLEYHIDLLKIFIFFSHFSYYSKTYSGSDIL